MFGAKKERTYAATVLDASANGLCYAVVVPRGFQAEDGSGAVWSAGKKIRENSTQRAKSRGIIKEAAL